MTEQKNLQAHIAWLDQVWVHLDRQEDDICRIISEGARATEYDSLLVEVVFKATLSEMKIRRANAKELVKE